MVAALNVIKMAKKKGKKSSSAGSSAESGASQDSADGGASSSAERGASVSAHMAGAPLSADVGASASAHMAGAPLTEQRAAMASALDLGTDAAVTADCTKIIMKNTSKLTRSSDYASWAPAFLTLCSITCVQGWAIAMGKTTRTRKFDPKTQKSEEIDPDALEAHQSDVYMPYNAWLYRLIGVYLSGPKMRTIITQAIPNDGYGLWQTLKARMERGGAVRKRALLQQFWRAVMKPMQRIVAWTDELGGYRVALADQFDVDISDMDICGQALQGLKPLYRPVRDAMNAMAADPNVLWEAFVVELHRACDVIDLDAQTDAEANAAVTLVAERKRRYDARIRELEAEIAELRRGNASAEESVTEEKKIDSAEESGHDAEEPSSNDPDIAGLAFSFH